MERKRKPIRYLEQNSKALILAPTFSTALQKHKFQVENSTAMNLDLTGKILNLGFFKLEKEMRFRFWQERNTLQAT